jgi:predicted transcriptional regulator
VVTRDGAAIRKERIQSLMDIIKHNPEQTDQKIMFLFCLKWGNTAERAKEYLDWLIENGAVERTDDGKLKLLI